jgi:hypothetical protein
LGNAGHEADAYSEDEAEFKGIGAEKEGLGFG